MNAKKTLGIILIIMALGLIGMSFYIKTQVDEGKAKVLNAQEKVDKANKLFSFSSTTKEIGDTLTSPVQKKIDKGHIEVIDYQTFSGRLLIGGILALFGGIGLIIWSQRRVL